MRVIARLFIAAAFGFGYLVHHSGLGAAGAQAPPPGPTITIQGALRDQAGAPVPDRPVQVMLLEHRSPAEIEASVEQAAIVVEGAITGTDGSYSVQIPTGSIPPAYVGPAGRVEARLLSPGPDTGAFATADFNVFGLDGVEAEAVAAGAALAPTSQVVTVDAELVPAEGAPSSGPVAAAIDPWEHCHWPSESYGWSDTGLGAMPYASVGRAYTRGGAAMAVGAYNGSQYRTESFASLGGAFFRAGVVASQDTSVDWSVLVAPWGNWDVTAQTQYRHRQLFCQNVDFGTRRWANVGEFYPYRPTASVLLQPRSGEPFPCSFRSDFEGQQSVTVSRGRTRSTSGSFSIANVPGRVGLSLSTSSSFTSTTINRVSFYGQLPNGQHYTLCGNDEIPIAATWVREK